MKRIHGNVATTTATICLAGLLAIGAILSTAGCNTSQPAATDTRAADEAAVRKADGDWAKAAQTKNLDAWMAFYADDVVVLPPNEKTSTSKEEIRKSIAELLALPGIIWQPTKVEVAKSGDLAYSYGTYELTINDATRDHGKYLEIWKKQPDGNWKCIVDTWSSDLPAGPDATK